jgi:hypothetical protein
VQAGDRVLLTATAFNTSNNPVFAVYKWQIVPGGSGTGYIVQEAGSTYLRGAKAGDVRVQATVVLTDQQDGPTAPDAMVTVYPRSFGIFKSLNLPGQGSNNPTGKLDADGSFVYFAYNNEDRANFGEPGIGRINPDVGDNNSSLFSNDGRLLPGDRDVGASPTLTDVAAGGSSDVIYSVNSANAVQRWTVQDGKYQIDNGYGETSVKAKRVAIGEDRSLYALLTDSSVARLDDRGSISSSITAPAGFGNVVDIAVVRNKLFLLGQSKIAIRDLSTNDNPVILENVGSSTSDIAVDNNGLIYVRSNNTVLILDEDGNQLGSVGDVSGLLAMSVDPGGTKLYLLLDAPAGLPQENDQAAYFRTYTLTQPGSGN